MDDSDWRAILLGYLARSHESVLGSVQGLGEYDLRRPLTPSGTNLLGVVKHVATVEHGYLVQLPGRTSEADEVIVWNDEESMLANVDMWVEHSMSSGEVVDLLQTVAGAAEQTVQELALDTPVTVPWWPPAVRSTTLGRLAVHVISEIAQHAGHLEVLREQLDGRTAEDHAQRGDQQWWSGYVAKIAAEADRFA